MKILVTSVGSNTAISVIKGLKRIGDHRVTIIGTDINIVEECAGGKFVDIFIQMPAVVETFEYEDKLIQIVKNYKVDCVIPIHDLEIECVSRLSIKIPRLTFWAVNEPAVIELCNNKLLANEFVSERGVPVPYMFKNSEIPAELPVIIKPVRGVSSRGIQIIKDKSGLKDILVKDDFIVQKYVEGEEYTVDCYSDYSGRFFGGIARERIETKDGMSTKSRTILNRTLLFYCKLIHDGLNYKGASNIQFIISNGCAYFIEINPRFSGAGILSFKANFNSALFTVLEAAGKSLPCFDELDLNYGLRMVRYWEESFYEG